MPLGKLNWIFHDGLYCMNKIVTEKLDCVNIFTFLKKKLIKRISNKIYYMFDFKRVSKYLFSTWANWDQLPRQYFSAIFTETQTNAFLASFFCLQWWPSKLHLQNSINWLSKDTYWAMNMSVYHLTKWVLKCGVECDK